MIAVRANDFTLVERVFPSVPDDARADEHPEPFYVFRGDKVGWVLSYAGAVLFRSEESGSFEATLRSQVRSYLSLRHPAAAVFRGRFTAGEPPVLQVHTDPECVPEAIGYVLVTEDESGEPEARGRGDGLTLARLHGARVLIVGGDGASTGASMGGPPGPELEPAQAALILATSCAGFGSDPARSLDLVASIGTVAGQLERRCGAPEEFVARTDAAGDGRASGPPPRSADHDAWLWARRPVRRPGVLRTRVNGQCLAVAPSRGQAVLLDPLAESLYDAFDGAVSVRALAAEIADLFDEDDGVLRERLITVVDEFLIAGILLPGATTDRAANDGAANDETGETRNG